MSDTNVKIKLSADASQVRNEIKLIDKELQELGGGGVSTNSTRTKSSRKSSSSSTKSSTPKTSKTKAQTDTDAQRERALKTSLQKELTLVRKELQKLNKTSGTLGTNTNLPDKSPTAGGTSTPNTTPSSPSVPNKDSSGNGKLADALGKIASAAVVLKAASSAYNYVSSGANSSMSGESRAYQVYGKTLAYSDYYTAKKDAKTLGAPYGYTYDEVMNAADANMSLAGFTNLNNYQNDLDAILGTSKAWGINSSSLANASGYMSSIGVTESGSQKKFVDMLSESIVQAEMTGREDEQLQVLETISETLARTLVKVDENSLSNAVALYTSVAEKNPTLKGSRGASIVESINNSIVNGDSTLDVLLGWGTDYTGVEGRVALQKLKEQGLTNPETLSKIFNNFEKYTGKSIDSSYGQMFLSNKLGLSYSQVEALLGSKEEIMSGKFNSSILENGTGTQDRLNNYNNADVSAQEKYPIETQDTKESIGENLNNILKPFREWYSGLSTGGKFAVDTAKGAATLAASGAAIKGLKKGAGSLINGLKGSSSGASAPLASVADDVVGNSVDDVVASAASNTAASTAASTAKGLLGKALGPIIQLGIGAYNYSQAKNDTERSSAVGQSTLGTLGGVVGSFAGPLGSIAGSYAGGELGKAVGEDVQDAKANYGTRLAALPLIGGLWKKKGTLIEQEINKEQSDLKAKYSAAKPSDYGLPKDFDKALEYYESDGEVKANVRSGVLEHQFGYSEEELDKLFSSKKFYNWMKSQDKNANKNSSESAKSENISTGIKTDSPKMLTIAKDFGDYQDKYDASKDTLKQGYYTVWTGTKKELEEYKANRGAMLTGSDYWTRAKTAGATEENPYMEKSNKSVQSNTDALDKNTEAMKKLYEDKGLVYGAPYSSNYLKSKMNPSSGTLGSSQESSSGLFGTVFSKLRNLFGSHATGNDYVPYDNYLASLHKGEMVLTKFEADEYRQKSLNPTASTGTIELNLNLNGSIDGMNSENQSKIVAAIVQQINNSGLQDMLSTGYTRVQNY